MQFISQLLDLTPQSFFSAPPDHAQVQYHKIASENNAVLHFPIPTAADVTYKQLSASPPAHRRYCMTRQAS